MGPDDVGRLVRRIGRIHDRVSKNSAGDSALRFRSRAIPRLECNCKASARMYAGVRVSRALPVEALNPGTAPKIARAGEELRFFPIPDNFGSSLQHTFLYQ
jgi:hypothetical protein